MKYFRKIIGLVRSYFVHIQFDNDFKLNNFRIGKNFVIHSIKRISVGERVHIGSDALINCGIPSKEKSLLIGNNIYIGRSVQINAYRSVRIDDNVVMGGQAGISGHLKIGKNVKIGGGSGVINNIPDNYQIMGYPAVPLKDFIKQRKINEK